MDTQTIIQRLKEIRSGSHCKPPEWLENELSRLIAKLEAEDEWDSLMRGETLVNIDATLSYKLVRG